MTAPDTNVEKQARNHRGPLWGIMLCFVFVALLTVGWLVLYGDEEPGGGDDGADDAGDPHAEDVDQQRHEGPDQLDDAAEHAAHRGDRGVVPAEVLLERVEEDAEDVADAV